jgi:hypothetical protein
VIRARWTLFVLVLLNAPAAQAQDGRLQQAREEMSAPDREKPSSSSTSADEWDDAEGEFFGRSFFYSAFGLFYGLPHGLCGDDFADRGYFPRYPYADGRPGHLLIRFNDDQEQARGWFGRLAVEYGSDFRDLDRFNGHLLLDSCARVGVQASWSYLTESLGAVRSDDMLLADVNLVYRFAQSETVALRSGLGVRCADDRYDTRAGVNFTYGGDFFPARPWVVSGVLDLGSLGSAFVVHGRVTAGALLGGCEAFVGYDYLSIGGVEFQGPVAGLRLWF